MPSHAPLNPFIPLTSTPEVTQKAGDIGPEVKNPFIPLVARSQLPSPAPRVAASERFVRGVGEGILHPVRAFLPDSWQEDKATGFAGGVGEFVGMTVPFALGYGAASRVLTGVGLMAAKSAELQVAASTLAGVATETFAGESVSEAPQRAAMGAAYGAVGDLALMGIARAWRGAAPKWVPPEPVPVLKVVDVEVPKPKEAEVAIHPLRLKLENALRPNSGDTPEMVQAKIRALGKPQAQMLDVMKEILETKMPGGQILLSGLTQREVTQVYQSMNALKPSLATRRKYGSSGLAKGPGLGNVMKSGPSAGRSLPTRFQLATFRKIKGEDQFDVMLVDKDRTLLKVDPRTATPYQIMDALHERYGDELYISYPETITTGQGTAGGVHRPGGAGTKDPTGKLVTKSKIEMMTKDRYLRTSEGISTYFHEALHFITSKVAQRVTGTFKGKPQIEDFWEATKHFTKPGVNVLKIREELREATLNLKTLKYEMAGMQPADAFVEAQKDIARGAFGNPNYYKEDTETFSRMGELLFLDPKLARLVAPNASAWLGGMMMEEIPKLHHLLSKGAKAHVDFFSDMWRQTNGPSEYTVFTRGRPQFTKEALAEFGKTGWAPGMRAMVDGRDVEFLRRVSAAEGWGTEGAALDHALVRGLDEGKEDIIAFSKLQRPTLQRVVSRDEAVLKEIDKLLGTKLNTLPISYMETHPTGGVGLSQTNLSTAGTVSGVRKAILDVEKFVFIKGTVREWIRTLPEAQLDELNAALGQLKPIELERLKKLGPAASNEHNALMQLVRQLGYKGIVQDDEGFLRVFVADRSTITPGMMEAQGFNSFVGGASQDAVFDVSLDDTLAMMLRMKGVPEVDLDYFMGVAKERVGARMRSLVDPKVRQQLENVQAKLKGKGITKTKKGTTIPKKPKKGKAVPSGWGEVTASVLDEPVPMSADGFPEFVTLKGLAHSLKGGVKGKPGTSVEAASAGKGAPGPAVAVVQRNSDGDPLGVLLIHLDKDGRTPLSLDVAVAPSERRKGVATALYRKAKEAGYDVELASGRESSLTPEGRRFVEGRRAKGITASAISRGGSDKLSDSGLRTGARRQLALMGINTRDELGGISAKDLTRFGLNEQDAKEAVAWARGGGIETVDDTVGSLAFDGDSPSQTINRAGLETVDLGNGQVLLRDFNSKTTLGVFPDEDMAGQYAHALTPDNSGPPLLDFPGVTGNGGNGGPPKFQSVPFPPDNPGGPPSGPRAVKKGVHRGTGAETLTGSWFTALENFAKNLENKGFGAAYTRVYLPAHNAMLEVQKELSVVTRDALGGLTYKDKLQELSKGLVTVSKKRHPIISGYMEALTKEEIQGAGGLMTRAMTHNELRVAQAVEGMGLANDIPRLMSTERLIQSTLKGPSALALTIERMRKIQLSPEATQLLAKFESFPKYKNRIDVEAALGLTNEEKQVIKVITDSMKADKDKFSIYAVSRYASAPRLEKGFKTGREQFAAQNKMTKKELEAARVASQTLEAGFLDSGLDAKRHLSGYWPHLRMWVQEGWSPDEQLLPPEVLTWVSARIRSGELDVYDVNPLSVTYRHLRGLYMKRHFDPVMPDVRKALEGLQGKDQGAFNVMNEYVLELMGKPHESFAQLQGTLSHITETLLGKPLPKGMMTDIINGLSATVGASVLPFRVAPILRNFTESLLKVAPRTGTEEYFRALKYVTSKESKKEAFQSALNAGAIRPGVQKVRSLHSAEELFGPEAPGALAKYLHLFDKGFEWYQSADDWGRAIAFHAQRFRVMDNLDDYMKGRITMEQLKDRAKINTFDPLDAQIAEQFILDGNHDKAINHLGAVLSREAMTRYGYADHPAGWNSVQGRLLGQFGTWPVQYKDYLVQGATRGSTKDKAEFFMTHAAISGSIISAGAMAGVNLTSWVGFSGLAFTGGPVADLGIDVIRSINGSELERTLARHNLYAQIPVLGWMETGNPRSLFLPGSYLLGDLNDAREAMKNDDIFNAVMEGTGMRVIRPDDKGVLAGIYGLGPLE